MRFTSALIETHQVRTDSYDSEMVTKNNKYLQRLTNKTAKEIYFQVN